MRSDGTHLQNGQAAGAEISFCKEQTARKKGGSNEKLF